MEIVRGGIYILKDEYIPKNDLLCYKRPIVALNVEKNDSFFSAVRIGIFKSFRDSENKLFIELKIRGIKYFSTVLCDRVLEFPKKSVKEAIGTLDEKTIRIIENKLFNLQDSKDVFIQQDENLFNQIKNEDITDELKEGCIVEANITIKDINEFRKYTLDTNEKISFLHNNEIKRERKEEKQKKIKWILIIISNITSFILGICSSYVANHLDNEISFIIDKITDFFIENL